MVYQGIGPEILVMGNFTLDSGITEQNVTHLSQTCFRTELKM